MELIGDVVIVGAGIAGLTTSLGLHRIKGFALTTWTNAWKALDAIGLGDSLRKQHKQLLGNVTSSRISGLETSEMSFKAKGKWGYHEVRCVQRKLLLETLERELPSGTIRFSSKVVLIGCDGVNSVVAKWLRFKKAAHTGRSAIWGCAKFKNNHGFDPLFMQFFGNGVRSGAIPCDDNFVYWYFTWTHSSQEKELEANPVHMKQLVLSKLGNIPEQVRAVIENTETDLVWGNISKGNVCVAEDALHPMTPDIGQGGFAALEDGVILARCLGKALLEKPNKKVKDEDGEDIEEYMKIEMGLKKYANERRWRSFELISTSYVVSFIQENDGKVISFLRDKFLTPIMARLRLKIADFDCGKLNIP
ncbi:hypothetical protein UlMin_030976 [Ulmus minor]